MTQNHSGHLVGPGSPLETPRVCGLYRKPGEAPSPLPWVYLLLFVPWQESPPGSCFCCLAKVQNVQPDRKWAAGERPFSQDGKKSVPAGAEPVPAQKYIREMELNF